MKKFLLLITLPLLLAGCLGGSKSGGGGSPTNPPINPPVNPPVLPEPIELVTQEQLHNKTYLNSCEIIEDGSSYQTQIIFFDNEAQAQSQFYPNNDCSGNYTHFVLNIFHFNLREDIKGAGQKIDLTAQEQIVFLGGQMDTIDDDMNDFGVCGITTWEEADYVSILGRNCSGSPLEFGYIYKANESLFTILAIKDGKLLLGDTDSSSGKTELARPQTLDSNSYTEVLNNL